MTLVLNVETKITGIYLVRTIGGKGGGGGGVLVGHDVPRACRVRPYSEVRTCKHMEYV